MRASMKMASVALASSLALAACGSGANTTDSASGDGALKVGMAYDVGGRGDQSFNDSAARGLDKAKAELGAEIKEASAVDGENDAARESRLQQLVDAGYNHVVAVGFAYAKAVGKVAKDNPDVEFAIIDDSSDDSKGDNVAQLTFAEQEGSYLAGAAAALKSKTDNIGFVGGVNVPLINKFDAGFQAGAKKINPNIKIQSAYISQPPDFSGFKDKAKAKTAATGMFDKGADIVYQAAGASGGGVFDAAKAAKGWAIGVDSDQAKTADAGVRDIILTSMVKNVDVAVFDWLKSSKEGDAKTGNTVYNLKDGGVSLSYTGGHIDDIKAKLDALKQEIIDGKIVPPTTVK